MQDKPTSFAAASAPGVNKGSVAVEQSRSVTEAIGQLYIAKQFPRDPFKAYGQLIEACLRVNLANQAIYSYPRGGQVVKGASIRLAEELARCWGNIDFGIKELSQGGGQSEWQTYAWDMETNVRSTKTFTVKHERHTKVGVQRLTDPRDIYEIGANAGGRRLRACILAVMPPDMVDAAVEQCMKTLSGDLSKSQPEKIRDMVAAFGKVGVTVKHIEERIGKPLTDIFADELVELRTIYQSIKDGIGKPSDFFGVPDETSRGTSADAAAEANKELSRKITDDRTERKDAKQ